jgi:hypothetical protein
LLTRSTPDAKSISKEILLPLLATTPNIDKLNIAQVHPAPPPRIQSPAMKIAKTSPKI